ncbi:hypothetical protein CEXT_811771 [Caerostris extrusa]|uniref:Uncharacterized protein n=1 Tax=Caerostris extrusa TaxID=172846 RepID=A0AAV4NIW7_CAEEX|nr:hypothetical protein CEXT_811771 [Caerostris extrusa]
MNGSYTTYSTENHFLSTNHLWSLTPLHYCKHKKPPPDHEDLFLYSKRKEAKSERPSSSSRKLEEHPNRTEASSTHITFSGWALFALTMTAHARTYIFDPPHSMEGEGVGVLAVRNAQEAHPPAN